MYLCVCVFGRLYNRRNEFEEISTVKKPVLSSRENRLRSNRNETQQPSCSRFIIFKMVRFFDNECYALCDCYYKIESILHVIFGSIVAAMI